MLLPTLATLAPLALSKLALRATVVWVVKLADAAEDDAADRLSAPRKEERNFWR